VIWIYETDFDNVDEFSYCKMSVSPSHDDNDEGYEQEEYSCDDEDFSYELKI